MVYSIRAMHGRRHTWQQWQSGQRCSPAIATLQGGDYGDRQTQHRDAGAVLVGSVSNERGCVWNNERPDKRYAARLLSMIIDARNQNPPKAHTNNTQTGERSRTPQLYTTHAFHQTNNAPIKRPQGKRTVAGQPSKCTLAFPRGVLLNSMLPMFFQL